MTPFLGRCSSLLTRLSIEKEERKKIEGKRWLALLW
jgi:hypothetical protein